MFSAGIGHVTERNLYKDKPSDNMLITRIGGPAYRIGVGGGASSSKCANSKIGKEDLSAVQRINDMEQALKANPNDHQTVTSPLKQLESSSWWLRYWKSTWIKNQLQR